MAYVRSFSPHDNLVALFVFLFNEEPYTSKSTYLWKKNKQEDKTMEEEFVQLTFKIKSHQIFIKVNVV